MGDTLPIVVGVAVMIVGVIMIVSHMRAWKNQQSDPLLNEDDLAWLRKRYRRRMQTSAMLVLIGLMIPIGDRMPAEQRPLLFSVFWLIVLGATCWVVLLALGDLVSTKAHTRAALSRVRRQQNDLRQEIARLQNGHEGNGQSVGE